MLHHDRAIVLGPAHPGSVGGPFHCLAHHSFPQGASGAPAVAHWVLDPLGADEQRRCAAAPAHPPWGTGPPQQVPATGAWEERRRLERRGGHATIGHCRSRRCAGCAGRPFGTRQGGSDSNPGRRFLGQRPNHRATHRGSGGWAAPPGSNTPLLRTASACHSLGQAGRRTRGETPTTLFL